MESVLETMNDFAIYIEQQITQRGWTERHFEDVTGISKTALRSMLTGETKVPKLESLQRLAKALDTSLGHLIELCGFEVGDFNDLSDEERAILAQIPPERRLNVLRRALDLDQGDTPA